MYGLVHPHKNIHISNCTIHEIMIKNEGVTMDYFHSIKRMYMLLLLVINLLTDGKIWLT